ncbi:unnamed protein product [Chilo suppressalis]|uniref:Uncharacterized protein n=1 Tax=Chilo suppressalis TaxID=168631 RepID=A0ABN8AQI9_CHISP|nr:hypothetical protein evm_003779 [Chilo suppressalis]CAH0397804.1 unnamed protein product [Chilo suppressalis]
MSPDDAVTIKNNKQEIRAKLREDFLLSVNELLGEPVKILTYEQSMLQATLSKWKSDGSEVLVKDLETPASIKMPSAILRLTDILAIQFENQVDLP